MLTCSKTYTDIPFAHRQHKHGGHCAFIHGHNWAITFTFTCSETDENGFVVDFGGLSHVREWLMLNLDHACLFNADDPLREVLVEAAPEAWKPVVVQNCSAEGIARWAFENVDPLVRQHSSGRVWLVAVEVAEDDRNRAEYRKAAG